MPQPALSVSPASWTLLRMSSIESPMIPDTVQLMVDVAGLCSRAPALLVTRPAGIAPRRKAQTKRSYHCSRAPSFSTSASARATRLYVSSIVLSTGVPSLADKRYFLSQMSSDASWKGMASTSLCSSLTTLFMDGCYSPMFRMFSRKRPNRKKERPHARSSYGSAWFIAVCCQTARHSSPRFSPSSRCRDTTSCVGVGRVGT